MSKLESSEFGVKGGMKGLQSITNFTARIEKKVTPANFTAKIEKKETQAKVIQAPVEKPREDRKVQESIETNV